jgi:hypothetical protein
MTEPTRVAVPRKGRPLAAVLERLAGASAGAPVDGADGPTVSQLADDIISTLQYEKAIAKGAQTPSADVYDRLAEYSDLSTPYAPEFTLLRDDRPGMPRRIVFDSVTLSIDGQQVQLVGREEPFRAIRTHEFALGFDSADLVLEEVVDLQPEPLSRIADLNARIDPLETDVRVVTGLGDTVHHTLLGTPNALQNGPTDQLDREFVAEYEGPMCISPRYERLVTAVLGTRRVEDVSFRYPDDEREEEAAIADDGLGVYLTMTGSTAREHGLVLGEELFPSETVLMENVAETGVATGVVKRLFVDEGVETELAVP